LEHFGIIIKRRETMIHWSIQARDGQNAIPIFSLLSHSRQTNSSETNNGKHYGYAFAFATFMIETRTPFVHEENNNLTAWRWARARARVQSLTKPFLAVSASLPTNIAYIFQRQNSTQYFSKRINITPTPTPTHTQALKSQASIILALT